MGQLPGRLGHRGGHDVGLALELGHDLAQLVVAPGVVADPARHAGQRLAGAAVVTGPVAGDGFLTGAGGEDPGDGTIDVAIPLLQVVDLAVGVLPAELDRDVVEGAVAIDEAQDRAGLTADLAVGEVEPEDDLESLLGHEVADRHDRPAVTERLSRVWARVDSTWTPSGAVTSRRTSRATISNVSPTSLVT